VEKRGSELVEREGKIFIPLVYFVDDGNNIFDERSVIQK